MRRLTPAGRCVTAEAYDVVRPHPRRRIWGRGGGAVGNGRATERVTGSERGLSHLRGDVRGAGQMRALKLGEPSHFTEKRLVCVIIKSYFKASLS